VKELKINSELSSGATRINPRNLTRCGGSPPVNGSPVDSEGVPSPKFKCSTTVPVTDTSASEAELSSTTKFKWSTTVPATDTSPSEAEQRAGALKWAKAQYPEQRWIWDTTLSKSQAAKLKAQYKKEDVKKEAANKGNLSEAEQHRRARAWADEKLKKTSI
jgi:hypothetical protein